MWIITLGPTAKPIVESRLGALVRHGAGGEPRHGAPRS